MTAGPYAALVAAHGLSPAHRLVLEAVPRGARVLDVGCATGYLAAELAARGSAVVGVEADPAAAAEAAAACERVVTGDVESAECRAALAALAPFDAIVCADVLEHLRDPWAALGFLAPLLRPGGRAVLSVPNIGHWTARRALFRGRFPYAAHGLFDRTHLRFFTRATMVEMFQDCGYDVLSCEGANTMGRRWAASDSALLRAASRVVPLPFGDMAYVHFVVVACPRRP